MLLILLATSVLPFASSSGLKAIQYGTIASAKTLVALPTTLAVDVSRVIVVKGGRPSLEQPILRYDSTDGMPPDLDLASIAVDDVNDLEPAPSADRILPNHNSSIDTLDIDISASLLIRRADDDDEDAELSSINEKLKDIEEKMRSLMKEAKADNSNDDFRGIMQMDCYESPEACKNACFWQHCLQAPQGLNLEQRYFSGRTGQATDRIRSGNNADMGPPCRNWPLSQRVWDRHPLAPGQKEGGEEGKLIKAPAGPTYAKENGNLIALQADEWPMASMWNDEFDSNADKVQHSLRCIPGDDNLNGGRALDYFYLSKKHYNQDSGKWKDWRVDGKSIDKDTKDWFYVHFNFEHFDDGKEEDIKIKKQLEWCHSPSENTCKSDGLQYHLSELRTNPSTKSQKNHIEFPYDFEQDSLFKMTEPGKDTEDIHQYWLYIHESEEEDDTISLTIQEQRGGEMKPVAEQQPTKLDDDGKVTLGADGSLKQSIVVTKGEERDKKRHYNIEYAPESVKEWGSLRYYPFDTATQGDGQKAGSPFYKRTVKEASERGKTPYCMPCTSQYLLPDGKRTSTDLDKGPVAWMCTFPAW